MSNRKEAPEIAERIRRAVADKPFVLDDGTELHKTASVGFAAFPFDPLHPRNVPWQQVVNKADEALYTAKTEGRNRWVGAS